MRRRRQRAGRGAAGTRLARRQLVEQLLSYCDRLVIGVFSEARSSRALEAEVVSWGFALSGRAEREHPHPLLAYRAFWIDAAS